MKLFRKILLRFALAVLILGVLLTVFVIEENWQGHRALVAYQNELEADGFRFGLDALRGPPVPDAQNFAKTPLLQPLFDYSMIPETGFYHLKDANAAERLAPPSAELRDLRKPVLWQKGEVAPLDEAQAQKILADLEPYAANLEIISAAARARPLARYPLLFEQGSSMPLGHLSSLQSFVQSFDLFAAAELALNQTDSAFADLSASLRVAQLSGSPALFITHLVRIAMLATSMEPFRTGLHLHRWNESQLCELQATFTAIKPFAEWQNALRGEAAGVAIGMARLKASPEARRRNARGLAEEGNPLGQLFAVLPIDGWVDQNFISWTRITIQAPLGSFNANADRVYPQQIRSDGPPPMTTPYNYLSRQWIIPSDQLTQKTAYMAQALHFAELACALERYWLVQHHYPATLTALSPAYLAALPHDVCNGQPLQYRAEPDGGYRIWSVGWDLKDDGGKVVLQKSGGLDYKTGDWAWIMPAHAAEPAAQ